ncbi:WD40 repeat domain-containing protein [Gimesia aquarii]|uniref:WD domain, G-beta repeat n=1 Tax=Gimesia aquarii TaxID=2527964 RepID=A0A517WX58_9PLAN|nr:hypothetical protein [Gimesia aquarii]QDU09853.1 WD domain, G-beta repeat [Gimesia aquarii]
MNHFLWSASTFLILIFSLWSSPSLEADQQSVFLLSESAEAQIESVKTKKESDRVKPSKSVKIADKSSRNLRELPWKENPLPLIPLPPEAIKKQLPAASSHTQKVLSWGGNRQQVFSHYGNVIWFEWLNGNQKLVIAEGDRKKDTRLSVKNIIGDSILWEKWILNGVTSMAVSPDGSELAVANSNDQITLINSSDGTSKLHLSGHLGDIRRMRYSADGDQLVSLSFDRTAGVWDTASGNIITRTRVHEQTPFDIGLSEQSSTLTSNAMRLLVCGSNGSLQWWTVGKTRLMPDPIFPQIGIRYPKYPSRDGRLVITLDGKQTATLFDGATAKEIGSLELPSSEPTKTVPEPAPKTIRPPESKPDEESVNKTNSNVKAALQSMKINAVVFSPDKNLVAGGTTTGQIMIWSAVTRKLLGTLKGHTAPVVMMSFTQDNSRLASSAYDGALIIWDVETATEQKRLFPATDSIRPSSLVQKSILSTDGHIAVLPRIDGEIDVLDLESRRKSRRLGGPPGKITSLAVNESGEQIVAGYQDGVLSLWNLKDAASTALRINAVKSTISVLAIKQKKIIAGTTDGKLVAVDLSTGRVVTTVSVGKLGVDMITINSAGTLAAIVSGAKELQLIRLPSLEKLNILTSSKPQKKQKTVIRAVAFAPVGNQLAVVDSHGQVNLWDISESSDSVKVNKTGTVTVPATAAFRRSNSNSNLLDSQTHPFLEVGALRFSTGSQYLLVSAGSEIVTVDCSEAKIHSALNTSIPAVSLAVRPEDSRLLVLSNTGNVFSWLPTVHLKHEIAAHKGDAKFVLVTPNGKSIVSGGKDKKVKIWNATTGGSVKTLTGGIGVVTRGSMTSTGNLLATCGYSSAVELWDLPQQKLISKRYGHGSRVVAVALSPNEKRIASSEEAGPLLIRTLPRFKTEVTIPKQELPVTRIIWMPDGEHILTSTGDWKQWHLQGQVRVWNAITGKQKKQLDGIRGQTTYMLLTPDGRFLITASYDKVLRIWDTEKWIIRAKVLHDKNIRSMTFFDNGHLLACVMFPNSGFVLDTQNGKIRNQFQIPTSLVQDVAAAWDANWFVTSGINGSLQTWHLSNSESSK